MSKGAKNVVSLNLAPRKDTVSLPALKKKVFCSFLFNFLLKYLISLKLGLNEDVYKCYL